MNETDFQALMRQRGRELYRDMPWRDEPNPYYVWLSELMLQQTQVARVIPKFQAFIQKFPTIIALSQSTLAEVLVAWSGLGYNRRAKFLWEAAQEVSRRFAGVLPSTYDELTTLPGIGPNTAGAIMNYAYQIPTVFIETNIRSVYFHHYFHHRTDVTDNELRIVVERTIDRAQPREFFWALMDYGAYLKSTGSGQIDRSRHYKKQSQLKGSLREMRGAIVRALAHTPLNEPQLRQAVAADDRFERALDDLQREKLIERRDQHWRLREDR